MAEVGLFSHAGPGLFPWQFSQLSKYDVTGIGLNIGESANANGEPSLKVFGIVLGSPAQLAGVRQVCLCWFGFAKVIFNCQICFQLLQVSCTFL